MLEVELTVQPVGLGQWHLESATLKLAAHQMSVLQLWKIIPQKHIGNC